MSNVGQVLFLNATNCCMNNELCTIHFVYMISYMSVSIQLPVFKYFCSFIYPCNFVSTQKQHRSDHYLLKLLCWWLPFIVAVFFATHFLYLHVLNFIYRYSICILYNDWCFQPLWTQSLSILNITFTFLLLRVIALGAPCKNVTCLPTLHHPWWSGCTISRKGLKQKIVNPPG